MNPIENSEIDIGVPMQIRISTEIIENIPIALSLKEIGFISKQKKTESKDIKNTKEK